MTPEHVIFIPSVLMVGMFLGFIFGTRAARNHFDLAQRREEERLAAQAARAERRAAKVSAPSADAAASGDADKPTS
jgi:hypothetical protein